MPQQLHRGTVKAVFPQGAVKIQFGPGLFPIQKRLVAVVGDRGLQAAFIIYHLAFSISVSVPQAFRAAWCQWNPSAGF